jgi:CheY-like chemotaxis protein
VGVPSDQLRVSFEALSLRQAVELAAELRTMVRGTIQVRPAPLRILTRRRWTVILTTGPVSPARVREWEGDMKDLAQARSGCRFVGAAAPLRVVIVDDSAPFRRAASELLTRRGFVVVGEASTAEGAIETVERLAPDALLLDIHLPDGGGFELARFLTGSRPDLAVLLTSADDRPPSDLRLEACGARGFAPKCCLAATPLERYWRTP